MCAISIEVSVASGGIIVKEVAVVGIAGGVSRGTARAMFARAKMTACARMIILRRLLSRAGSRKEKHSKGYQKSRYYLGVKVMTSFQSNVSGD